MVENNANVLKIADKELISAPEENELSGEVLENKEWRPFKGTLCIEQWALNDWLLRILPLLKYIHENGSGLLIYYPHHSSYSRDERISLVTLPFDKPVNSFSDVNVVALTSDYLDDIFQITNLTKFKYRLRLILILLGLPENEVDEKKYHVKLCEENTLPQDLHITDSFEDAKNFASNWISSFFR
jgi:hypothetical protein